MKIPVSIAATSAIIIAVSSLASTARAAIVEAEAVTTVTVEAPLFDTRLSSANGCDPVGCVGDLTRDGDSSTLESRWSCTPSLGPAGSRCSITYTLLDLVDLEGLAIAMFKGDERTRTLDIYVDGAMITTWTSSGTSAGFEMVNLGFAGQSVELRGNLADSEWLSILEVQILVDDGIDFTIVEAGTLGTVTTTAEFFDASLSTANGCDPAGCSASLTRDGDLADASRWSCAPKLGGACTIAYDLGEIYSIFELRLAMYQGTTRTRTVDVSVNGDFVTTWTSSGTTADFESIDLSGHSGDIVELTGVLSDSEWLSIKETEIMVLSDVVAPPTPTPAPTAGAPTGELQPVGLIPLADGCADELNCFYPKDGDMTTAWTCTADATDLDGTSTFYACSIDFDLFTFRHVKQVKIALADGADHSTEMRISGGRNDVELFVTSSGSTDGFETYDFDYFTNYVEISAIFATDGETINISEVEFIEEVHAEEVYVSDFASPYNNGDDRWNPIMTDSFEWTSDSDEALGRTLTFSLSSYTTLTAVEILFPEGDTYSFDLWLYDDQVSKLWSEPTSSSEPHTTIEGLESIDTAGWQSFDVTSYLNAGTYVTAITLVMRGSGSAPGFYMLDARIIGTPVDNPTNVFSVGSTYIQYWERAIYPDFVAERTGDQKAIMAAICAVKKASFDGVDCVGGDDAATGTVELPRGDFYLDGNIFIKSGVYIDGTFSDDYPHRTGINLEEGAAGKTDIDAIVVMDGISDVRIDHLWIHGLYDSETGSANPAVDGLGSTCLSITNSQNITCYRPEAYFCDGDGIVMRNSNMINLDAGRYDDQRTPWHITDNRGTGLVVDTCDSIWVRRYTLYDNGVGGIHVTGSNNFTFEATIGDDSSQGQGNVGSLDGLQPIDVVVESSTLVLFDDMRVQSTNDPVMTIAADASVTFDNCGFLSVDSGTCVIQTEDPATVTVDDDELVLVGSCYVKV